MYFNKKDKINNEIKKYTNLINTSNITCISTNNNLSDLCCY